MSITSKIQTFLWSVAIKKGIKRAVLVIVSFIGAKVITLPLDKWGIVVDASKMQTELTVLLTAILGTAQNWVKQKTGWTWL